VRHRKVDGFVILPTAFSDGRLSREAWRAVKTCLSTVRSTKRPSGLRVHAVCLSDSHWKAVRSASEIPIRATWVEVWRTIHRVHGVGVLRFSADHPDQELGVAVEPLQRANS